MHIAFLDIWRGSISFSMGCEGVNLETFRDIIELHIIAIINKEDKVLITCTFYLVLLKIVSVKNSHRIKIIEKY